MESRQLGSSGPQVSAMRKLARLEENIAAAEVTLSMDDLRELDRAATTIDVHGPRGTGQEEYA